MGIEEFEWWYVSEFDGEAEITRTKSRRQPPKPLPALGLNLRYVGTEKWEDELRHISNNIPCAFPKLDSTT